MRNRMFVAAVYADLFTNTVTEAFHGTKQSIIKNKSELARLGAAAVVVGLAARASGFQAGYAFANTDA